ncbi:predicted protein [Botrytis cinerea T4]|uniref:Uncharacterized protein n=1 Tax=Botryotinia fuckeliana (strain T4) TaxID=999810 RepID=G2YPW6_BOTF4|nr:predicted protein [Botrytis cinerea T4]
MSYKNHESRSVNIVSLSRGLCPFDHILSYITQHCIANYSSYQTQAFSQPLLCLYVPAH